VDRQSGKAEALLDWAYPGISLGGEKRVGSITNGLHKAEPPVGSEARQKAPKHEKYA